VAAATRELRIAIIGAGPGGLATAKRLLDDGYRDLVLLEQADEVGGTWLHNRYPGCECDVPSALYSFSWAPKPDWSKPYGRQPELLAYMRDVAERFGIRTYCRFGHGVVSARWDEPRAAWTLTLDSGATVEADVVVSAVGMFNELAWPDIEGLPEFTGALWHSAQWDWDHDLTGERVAVIGSAASAVQFVPEIVKVAGRVHLFQRTANWVMPKLDDPYTEEQLDAFRADDRLVRAIRAECERQMNKFMTFADDRMLAEREAAGLANIDQVRDPDVRAKLTPTHPFGCKRPLLSNHYYPAFNDPVLELVTEPIARVERDAVITTDGTRREVDTVIVATGFATTKYASAIAVRGRDGQSISDAWSDGPLAHLGITTAGFPNFFMLYGPNTNNGSIITMIEAQVEHVLRHVDRLAHDGIRWVDVRPDAMRRYNDDLQAAIARVRVWQAECNGYYRAPSGRIVTQWPHSMEQYEAMCAHLDPDDYEVARA
jgi:cation diffusion facilitator CzcD-associated flavoprotein CzcO